MKKVFGIGISGLIGTRIMELLSDRYEFQNLSIDTGVDITKPESLSVMENDTEHEIVLLLAAKADVDACERDKELGKEGGAWKINVEGARNVVTACKKQNKYLIYISTDFVFGGDAPDTGYTEDDVPSPVNWYGQTKYEAEKIVSSSGIPYSIVRLAYPYRTPFPLKKDLVQVFLTRLQEGVPLRGVTDHIMTPTFVDDFANALNVLLKDKRTGIYHVTGSDSLTPYEAILKIGKVFGLPTDKVERTTREEYFKGKAPRPFNLAMNNDRIEQLNVRMRGFEEGLLELKKQLSR